jgi:hypothetical protein
MFVMDGKNFQCAQVLFIDTFIMVIGGGGKNFNPSATVELISLDAENNPVPVQLQNRSKFLKKIGSRAAALISTGKHSATR